MQKRASFVVLTLGFLVLLAVSASAQTRVRAEYAVPPDARLEEYPLLPFALAGALGYWLATRRHGGPPAGGGGAPGPRARGPLLGRAARAGAGPGAGSF